MQRTSNYRTNIFNSLSFGVLLILPKCSLCIFAVGNAIAVCGLKPVITPFWEYLLIGLFVSIQLGMMIYEVRKGWKVLPLIIAGLGLASLIGFMSLELAALYYYSGVFLMAIGWIVLKTQNAIACTKGCNTSATTTFLIEDKT